MEPADQAKHAFDARRTWMSEASADVSTWSAVTLVTALRAVIGHGPGPATDGPVAKACPDPAARRSFIFDVMKELGNRGIDADSLIRFGLFVDVLARVLAEVVFREMRGEPDVVGPDDRQLDLEGWRAAFLFPASRSGKSKQLVLPLGTAETRVEAIMVSVVGGLPLAASWMWDTSIDDLIDARPPTRNELQTAARRESPDLTLVYEYRWIVDRLTGTFLADWASESLHLEYGWIHGFGIPAAPIEIMEERLVGVDLLNAEIAKRTVVKSHAGDSPSAHANTSVSLSQQVDRHARAFLADGRTREAAALFLFVSREEPTNASAFNNLGFCQIPEDPELALKNLERARQLNYLPTSINSYNRMCCQMALGRPRQALRIAEEYIRETGDRRYPQAAILWIPDTRGGWTLGEMVDAEEAIDELVNLLSATRRGIGRPREGGDPAETKDVA